MPRRSGRSTSARGYGHVHQSLRKRWTLKVATGTVLCARCGEPITPWDAWDLDHSDDRSGYLGPSHSRCNRATSKPRPRSREW